MRIKRLAPSPAAASFIRCFTIVETNGHEPAMRVLMPEPGPVLGFRYAGFSRELEAPTALPNAVVTGVLGSARRMFTSPSAGIILATFHESGAARVLPQPLHHFFGQSVALADVFAPNVISSVNDEIASAQDAETRKAVLERFLLAHAEGKGDPLIDDAIKRIKQAREPLRIRDLAFNLNMSVDRFEKRFRRIVGTSPKQLASILGLRRAVAAYGETQTFTRACHDAGYFDQSHFIREFRAFVGEPPARFFAQSTVC